MGVEELFWNWNLHVSHKVDLVLSKHMGTEALADVVLLKLVDEIGLFSKITASILHFVVKFSLDYLAVRSLELFLDFSHPPLRPVIYRIYD